MASIAVFVCVAAHVVVSSVAIHLGDEKDALAANKEDDDIHANSSDASGGCNSYNGGTCRVGDCNSNRGSNHCQWPNCYCDDGYCAGGSFYQCMNSMFGNCVRADTGHYCLQKCGKWHGSCGSTYVRKNSGHVCSGKQCQHRECCVEKDKCQASDCSSSEVLVKDTNEHCSGLNCESSECCAPRDKCTGSASFCSDAQVPVNAGQMCVGDACKQDECCAFKAICDGSQCDEQFNVKAEEGTMCEGLECKTEECCFPRDTCPTGNATICSETQVADPTAGLCKGTECVQDECCLEREKCNAGHCDPQTSLPVKNATLCQGASCTEQECCIPRGQCKDFDCVLHTLEKNTTADYCKGSICHAEECCQVANVPLPHATQTFQCTCSGEGNAFTCTNGEVRHCLATQDCSASEPFEYGKWEDGCKEKQGY